MFCENIELLQSICLGIVPHFTSLYLIVPHCTYELSFVISHENNHEILQNSAHTHITVPQNPILCTIVVQNNYSIKHFFTQYSHM